MRSQEKKMRRNELYMIYVPVHVNSQKLLPETKQSMKK